MIYDRPYMRSDHPRREISVLTWIIAITVGGYVVQTILREWFALGDLRYVALTLPGFLSGQFWTLVSYALIHDANPLHIVVNLVLAYFMGREVQQLIGGHRFVWLYMGAVVMGGLAWLPVARFTGGRGELVGCSAAVFALLTVLACFNWNRPVSLLFLPVTIRSKVLIYITAGISVFFLLAFELTNKGMVAHSSHLGGMLAGWLYFRYAHSRISEHAADRPAMELPAWLKRKKKAAVETPFKVDIEPSRDIKAEVDRILDKINSQGFGSLTEAERRVLDSARDVLNRR